MIDEAAYYRRWNNVFIMTIVFSVLFSAALLDHKDTLDRQIADLKQRNLELMARRPSAAAPEGAEPAKAWCLEEKNRAADAHDFCHQHGVDFYPPEEQ